MARPRKEALARVAISQAREKLHASIEQNPNQVIADITNLQFALVAAGIPQAEIFRELEKEADHALQLIQDPSVVEIIIGLHRGYHAVLIQIDENDPVLQARKALQEVFAAQDISGIIRCLGALHQRLDAAMVPKADVFAELSQYSKKALDVIQDPAAAAPIQSMKASYDAVLAYQRELNAISKPATPTNTSTRPTMTQPKG